MISFQKLLAILGLSGMLLACESAGVTTEPQPDYFLRDIRPTFFERLDFSSPERVAGIPAFLVRFTDLYKGLEQQYAAGAYTSQSDRDNLRLASMYYSFMLTAFVRASLDGFIRFEDIVGDRKDGFFSNARPGSPEFKISELRAMMDRSVAVAQFAVYVNGFNDKTLGSLMVARQIRGRVYDKQFFNSPAAQDSTIQYVNSTITNYEFFKDWNTFMSQLSFTNYNDPLNTFWNPNMNTVLANLNTRPIPFYTDRFATVVGPLFRYDMNMKKIDWLLRKEESVSANDLADIKKYIAVLKDVRTDLATTRRELFDKWPYKPTVLLRDTKLTELEQYVSRVEGGQIDAAKPQLSAFFSSKDFLQAYQCYNCHRSVR